MDKEEFLKRMGQKIRDLRNDRAWTLYDMEALTDIDSGDLSKIESGHTYITGMRKCQNIIVS